jgi:hypothetical protein
MSEANCTERAFCVLPWVAWVWQDWKVQFAAIIVRFASLQKSRWQCSKRGDSSVRGSAQQVPGDNGVSCLGTILKLDEALTAAFLLTLRKPPPLEVVIA